MKLEENSINHLKCGECGQYYHIFLEPNHLVACQYLRLMEKAALCLRYPESHDPFHTYSEKLNPTFEELLEELHKTHQDRLKLTDRLAKMDIKEEVILNEMSRIFKAYEDYFKSWL